MFKSTYCLIISLLILAMMACSNPASAPLKEDKDILSFSFMAGNNNGLSKDVMATIDDTKSTITAILPAGVALDGLVASFTTTGVAVFIEDTKQTSGVTSNNFSKKLVYTVRAENSSSRNYIVSIDEEDNDIADKAPGLPNSLSAESRNTGVLLEWHPPTDTGIFNGKTASITEYRVFYDTSQTVTTSSTEFTLEGNVKLTTTGVMVSSLTNDTSYYFAVLAVNGAGAGSLTDAVKATPTASPEDSKPNQPRDVEAAKTDNIGELVITWKAPINTGMYNGQEASIVEYTIYYDTGEITVGSPSVKVDGTTLTKTITGLTGGSVYYISVVARNGHDSGFPSEAIQATPRMADRVPGTPKSFTAKRKDQSVALEWQVPIDTGIFDGEPATITSYRVYYSTTNSVTKSSTEFTLDGGAKISETTVTVTGLTNGTKYYFAVLAVNGKGEGALTDAVSATPIELQPERAPGKPTGVRAQVETSPGSITIFWTAPTDAGIFDGIDAQLTGFRVYYSATAITPDSVNILVDKTKSSFQVKNLLGGYNYNFAVAAVNDYSTGALSKVVMAKPVAADSSPGIPMNLEAKENNNVGEIVLSWDAPTDKGMFNGAEATITGYKVYYDKGKVSKKSASVDVNNGVTTTISGLTSSLLYNFAVAALNEAGSSWLSEAVSAAPKRADSVPAAPQSVQAVATTNSGEIKVTWAVPADTGIQNGTAATITGYTVYYGTQSPSSSSSNVTTAGNVLTSTISGFSIGTEYQFAVSATNGHGESSLSDVATATSNVPANAQTLVATENRVMSEWGGSILIASIPKDNETLATAVKEAANGKYDDDNEIITSFVYNDWDTTHGYEFEISTGPGKSIACLNGLLITVDVTTYILDTSAITPFRDCNGGGTGGGGGEPKPGTYSLIHGGLTYEFDAASRVWDDELKLYYYQAKRTNTTFDGLTTVDASPKANRSGRYFMGYTGVWGQAFASNTYRSNASAFLSGYSAVEGKNVLLKLHDDDIMKNSIIGGAPATYTHLVISFMKPNGTYQRGSYDLSKTGLSYTSFPANDYDNRLGFIGLRESIRVAHRRNQKVILAVGGATYHHWEDLAAEGNSGVPGEYINSLAGIVIDLNADGLDVDYERHKKYGHSPTETITELRGAIKAMAKAIELAEEELNRDLILTIAGWSTGGDVSENTLAAGISSELAADFAGRYTQADKDAARAAWEASKTNGSSWDVQQAFKSRYDKISVGDVKTSIWGGGAGMHRHAFADESIVNLLDIVSIMAYDASYHNYDPTEAYNQYRSFVPARIPVLIGLQQPPEGWKDGQVLVTTIAEAGPKGTMIEADTYGNPISGASYSVERSMKHVVAVSGNPHDGGMHWTMSARDYTSLNLDPEAQKVGATADSIALQVAKDLGLPQDIRSHKAWTVWE